MSIAASPGGASPYPRHDSDKGLRNWLIAPGLWRWAGTIKPMNRVPPKGFGRASSEQPSTAASTFPSALLCRRGSPVIANLGGSRSQARRLRLTAPRRAALQGLRPPGSRPSQARALTWAGARLRRCPPALTRSLPRRRCAGCRAPTEVVVKVLTAKRRAICQPSTLATRCCQRRWPASPVRLEEFAIMHHAARQRPRSGPLAPTCARRRRRRGAEIGSTPPTFRIAQFSVGEDARKLLRL